MCSILLQYTTRMCGGYRTRAALRSARVRHDSPVVSPHRVSRQGLPPVSTSEDVSSARWNFAHAGLFDAAIVVQHDRERERGRQRHRESAIKLCGGYRTRAALRSARVRHDSPVVSPHRVSRQGLPPVSTSEDVSSARWNLRARRLVRRSYSGTT